MAVAVVPEDIRVTTERRVVERIPILPDQLRAWLPVHTYPVSAGVKGGFAGSIAMAVLACAYGVLKAGSVWYPNQSPCRGGLSQNPESSGPHSCIHFMQMLSRSLLFCTALCPSLWACSMARCCPCSRGVRLCLEDSLPRCCGRGCCTQCSDLLNPLLASHIDWFWFFASQVAFGIVAGLVVVRQARMPTRENVSFAHARRSRSSRNYFATRSGEERR